MLSLPRANVEVRDPDSGWTALHFASRQGKLATARVLIDNQAFIGAVAPDGRTPLHFTAGWGTYEVNGRSYFSLGPVGWMECKPYALSLRWAPTEGGCDRKVPPQQRAVDKIGASSR